MYDKTLLKMYNVKNYFFLIIIVFKDFTTISESFLLHEFPFK